MRTANLLLLFVIGVVAVGFVHASYHRRDQSTICYPPEEGCGYGIWNSDSCECNCIPPYCFDASFQACITPGSCPNVFEGCTPRVNCPYSANPMSGKCESGETINQGVYTIFWSNEDCCRASYQDPSFCLPPTPPTMSPSLKSTAMTELEKTDPQIATEAILLSPIPTNLYNLSSQFELDEDKRVQLEDIIWSELTDTSDNINVTILSVKILENIFSKPDQGGIDLEIHIEVTGARIFPKNVLSKEIYSAFHKALQDQVYHIASTLKAAWGPETYTNDVILRVGGVQTTLSPSLTPAFLNGVIAIPTHLNNDGPGRRGVAIWHVVLYLVLFSFSCGGLLFWQRYRGQSHISISPSSQSQHPTASATPQNQPFKSQIRQNKMSTRMGHIPSEVSCREYDIDPSSANSMYPRSRQMSRQSELDIVGTRGLDPPSYSNSLSSSGMNLDQLMGQADSGIRGRTDHNTLEDDNQRQFDAGEDQLEEGYDGGRSSFFISKACLSESSSDEEDSTDGSSSSMALGLLYHDGASSADESGEKGSRRSRRSRQTNKSGRTHGSEKSSRHSSGKSRHSSGKSSKSKSSRPPPTRSREKIVP